LLHDAGEIGAFSPQRMAPDEAGPPTAEHVAVPDGEHEARLPRRRRRRFED